jgi:hypothetical protein
MDHPNHGGNGGGGGTELFEQATRARDVENQQRIEGVGEPIEPDDDGPVLPEAEPDALDAAEQEKAKRKEVEEWFDRNQFGMLWEATTFLALARDSFRSSTAAWNDTKDFFSKHMVFSLHFYPFLICMQWLVMTKYGSPALLLNRMISTSTARAMLWFLVFFACLALQHIHWERLDQMYCETPTLPLLCLPLVAAPCSVSNFLSLYGPPSMVLFPLRALHTAAREKDQLVPPATVLWNFVTRFSLFVMADTGLYIYCRRAVWEANVVGSSSSPSPVLAEKTLYMLHEILQVIEWIGLAVLCCWLALASITRAIVVALVFLRRRGQRLHGVFLRWLNPHAHIE